MVRGGVLRLMTVAAAATLAACLGDPVGPGSSHPLVLQRLTYATDSVIAGAPGRMLHSPIAIRVTDVEGRPIGGAAISWIPTGTNARVDSADRVSGPDGTARARWTLGTDAQDSQALTVEVHSPAHRDAIVLLAHAVPAEVIHLEPHDDTLTVRLGSLDSVVVTAIDPFGNRFRPSDLRLRSLDSGVAVVDSTGQIHTSRRGLARVLATAGGVAETSFVHSIQIAQSITVDADTLRFHSLGQPQSVTPVVLDDRGQPIIDSVPTVSVEDTTVAKLGPLPLATVISNGNGKTTLGFALGSISKAVAIDVTQEAVRIQVTIPTATFDALRDTARMTVAMFDSLNAPISITIPVFESRDTAVVSVDAGGLVTTRGNGLTWVVARAPSGVSDSAAFSVAQKVVRVTVSQDSLLFTALHAVLPIAVTAFDRLGSTVVETPSFSVADGSVASVSPAGIVTAVGNGASGVFAKVASDSVFIPIQVRQRAVRVLVPADTVRFVALGETQQVGGVAVDSLGSRVAGPVGGLAITDTTVVTPADSLTIRSRGNGSTAVHFTVDSLPASVTIVVQQVPESIAVTLGNSSIQSAGLDSLLAISCEVRDRNGAVVAGATPTTTSHTGVVGNGTCGQNIALRSGFDTLTVRSGSAVAAVPVVVAIRPSTSSATGDFLQIDSLPGAFPWAPTAVANAQGGTDLYVAGYSSAPSQPEHILGNLYRLTSPDGINFRFDTLILPRDSSQCSLTGSGVENIAIVTRAEAPGLRMYYSAGSFACYGWQVFSAVSTDGRVWTPEPGVRLSNGGPVPPQAPSTPPYPVGEGMVVDQLPNGQYRMIVGTFEHTVPPPNNLWQIAEWRSSDQINWQYVGPLLTTRQMPPEGQGSVYSPTIVQIVPGLWRMLFTADARGTADSRSALWSAVSVDRENWQIEGQLLGTSTTDLYYATVAGSRAYFIRRDLGGSFRLASATVQMP